ncbi:MAG TPA: ATP synthase F1 subunit gamma [Bacteroidales bacterium]|nr:ATP synthase F1 subunit gamma [Bacteroidales bacterium]HPI87408.1 ATP synthase F1 subunit gamma [Bacteroidales bacterium]
MPSLKEVRIRIESIKSTQQITSAMKLVAASKLRRTQNAVQALAPYASKLREILGNLSASIDNTEEAVYTTVRPVQKVLLLVVTSNRGLCGPFNGNIIKAAKAHIEKNYGDINRNGHLDIMTIGKKGTDFFRKNKYNLVSDNHEIFDSLTFTNTTAMATALMADFAAKKYDRIEIIYNHFKNAGQQVITIDQYLPIIPVTTGKPADSKQKADYLFEPEKKVLIRELLPKMLKVQFYKIILDSFAAEHGARMTAMSQATENASEILKQLKLSYNKARQSAITKELLEIVSGAEALKG